MWPIICMCKELKGADHLTFEGRGRIWVISEKSILKTDLEQILQGNNCHTIALYVREKILSPEVWEKKILTQAHEITHNYI